MTPERYAQVSRVFEGAKGLSGAPGAERAAYLATACAGDDDLRRQVESLLAHADVTAGFLSQPILGEGFRLRDPELLAAAPGTPEHIGSYKIQGTLGSGGWGLVYLAEQARPKRTVALKVIRPGLVSAEMLRRFEQEVDVVGRLLHPGIAQIYEAGTADAGLGPQPFFAMELVQGQPLSDLRGGTGSPQSQWIGARERLDLMARICDAAHHAHQRGIIHRDLKPGNILVDQTGQPKILDFGVARMTGGGSIRAEGAGAPLSPSGPVGTIPYMSPEQAAGDEPQIDARSDVYALGVVCFELLSGQLPYDVRGLPIDEALQTVRDAPPTPLGDIDPALGGDVQVIVARALEKEKVRRYQSAADMAADIRRHLRGERIVAEPARPLERLRYFGTRNAALVVGIGLGTAGLFFAAVGNGLVALAMLALGVIGTSWQAVRAQRARAAARLAQRQRAREIDTSRRVMAFVGQMLRAGSAAPTPSAPPGAVPELLRAGAARVRSALADDSLAQAEVMDLMGRVYLDAALLTEAEPLLQDAVTLRRRELGDDDERTLSSIVSLGVLRAHQGMTANAESLLREAVERAGRVQGVTRREAIRAMHTLARLFMDQGRPEAAEPMARAALEAAEHAFGPDAAGVIESMDSLGAVLRRRGRLPEAVEMYRRCVGVQRRHLSPGHPDHLVTLCALADALADMGRTDECLSLLRQCLHPMFDGMWAAPRLRAALLRAAATLCDKRAHREAALACRRELLRVCHGAFGPLHPITTVARDDLAGTLRAGGTTNIAEAERLARDLTSAGDGAGGGGEGGSPGARAGHAEPALSIDELRRIVETAPQPTLSSRAGGGEGGGGGAVPGVPPSRRQPASAGGS